MVDDRGFLWILCSIYSIYTILRVKYRRNSTQKEVIIEQYEKNRGLLLLNRLILFEVITFTIFAFWIIFSMETIPFNLSFTNVWRWVGVFLGIIAIGLFWWVHHTLGEYFSPHLEVKDLITGFGIRCILPFFSFI